MKLHRLSQASDLVKLHEVLVRKTLYQNSFLRKQSALRHRNPMNLQGSIVLGL